MKIYRLQIISVIALFALSIALISCATSQNANNQVSPSPTTIALNENVNSPYDWASILRRVPGLKVSGSYPDLSVLIRGAKSVSQSNEPLYVLDGVPLGRTFSELAAVSDPSNVDNIRVLSGPEAAKYGARGANGVIEVISKS